jgi:membrane protease YdiL (CAAX protease family)
MLKNYLKISSPWSQLGLFFGLLGGGLVLASVMDGVILLAKGVVSVQKGLDLGDPRLTGALKFIQGLNTVVIFGIPSLLYARLTFREHPLDHLGFRKAQKNVFYLLAVALLLFSFPVEGWLGQLNKGIPLSPWMIKMEEDADRQIEVFLRVNTSFDVYVNLFLIALLPAVCEEACFRGALQRILIHAFKSPWVGIIATGIFFSAFHMQFEGFLPRMFLGILLGVIYWYSGSLWVSIAAHFFYNGFQVVAVSFYPKMIHENPGVPVYAALISLVIVVGLLSVMRRRSTTTYASIYEPENGKEYDGFPS